MLMVCALTMPTDVESDGFVSIVLVLAVVELEPGVSSEALSAEDIEDMAIKCLHSGEYVVVGDAGKSGH